MTQSSTPQIDPRGPRFTAGVTLVILAVALVTPRPVSIVLVALQTAAFAIGALRGVQFTPTAFVFRKVIRPRLSAPSELEDARPPRFAQTVGLGFTVVALIGYASGATLVGQIAVGFAVIAAFLNAVFGFCLGCELYLLIKRITPNNQEPTNTNQAEQTHNKKEAIA
ncbi:MAG: DUF4395 domain-containing protein [Marmoricola sp.]